MTTCCALANGYEPNFDYDVTIGSVIAGKVIDRFAESPPLAIMNRNRMKKYTVVEALLKPSVEFLS